MSKLLAALDKPNDNADFWTLEPFFVYLNAARSHNYIGAFVFLRLESPLSLSLSPFLTENSLNTSYANSNDESTFSSPTMKTKLQTNPLMESQRTNPMDSVGRAES